MTTKTAATPAATEVTLTAKETALMTAIAERHFSFFDGGLVANDSGIWTDTMTGEVAGSKKYEVSATQRGVATVINSLGRKGLLQTSTNEDGAWTELTVAGQVWVEAHNGGPEKVAKPAKAKAAAKAAAKPAKAPRAAAAPAAPAAAPEAPAATLADFTKGDRVKTRDGRVWTVIGPAQGDTTLKLKSTTDAKTTYRFPHNITKA